MLTEITSGIAETLATKVRVLTTDQLAEHFYPAMKNPHQCARRAARKLQREGYARTWPTMVTHLRIDQPLLAWTPGDCRPEFHKLAWQNQKRWDHRMPQKTVCLTSTDRAKARFGGSCREPRPRELEHDVNVAGVYLTLRHHAPEVAKSWRHEDSLQRANSLRPDALVQMNNEQVTLDLLGRGYPRKKIQAIWEHHQQHQLELW